MSKYGEPFYIKSANRDYDFIFDSNGQIVCQCRTDSHVSLFTETRPAKGLSKRIINCLNACDGIEDPADLRKQRDEAVEALKLLLAANDSADETGYVDGDGFIDIDTIKEKARQAIARCKDKEEK